MVGQRRTVSKSMLRNFCVLRICIFSSTYAWRHTCRILSHTSTHVNRLTQSYTYTHIHMSTIIPNLYIYRHTLTHLCTNSFTSIHLYTNPPSQTNKTTKVHVWRLTLTHDLTHTLTHTLTLNPRTRRTHTHESHQIWPYGVVGSRRGRGGRSTLRVKDRRGPQRW